MNNGHPKKIRASLVAQMVKRLPATRETQIRSLVREDPLEKEMAIHSSTLAWKIPWTEEPDGPQSMGSQRVGHDWATSFSFHLKRLRGNLPGYSTGDPTHDKVMRRRPDKQGFRTRGTPWAIPPMTRSCGRDLTSKADLEGPPGPARASTPKPESVLLLYVFSPGHDRSVSIQIPLMGF